GHGDRVGAEFGEQHGDLRQPHAVTAEALRQRETEQPGLDEAGPQPEVTGLLAFEQADNDFGDGVLALVPGEIHGCTPSWLVRLSAVRPASQPALSRGSPRMRSAATVSRICSVPPAMDRQRVSRNSVTSAVSCAPREPEASTANSATACRWRTPTSLRTLLNAPASPPASTVSAARCSSSWPPISSATKPPSRSAFSSAPGPLLGSLVISSSSAPPIPLPPMAIRSADSVERAIFQPLFSAPTRQSSGTKTSSRKTSLKRASPVICTSGRTSRPGLRMSTRK